MAPRKKKPVVSKTDPDPNKLVKPVPVVPAPPPMPEPPSEPERVKPDDADIVLHGTIKNGKVDGYATVDGVRLKGGVIKIENFGGNGLIRATIDVVNPQMLINTIIE